MPAPGCSKAANKASMAPDSQPDSTREAGGDLAYADDPLAELDALEGRMRALGLATARSKGATASPGDAVAVDGDDDEATADVAAAPEAAPAAEHDHPTATEQTGSRCGDLCDLSESICMLEVRICSLSDSHGEDPIYADACERAVDDCHTAGQACDACDA
ncbi:hypothetical protein DB30_06228 [Enhygromyxa salina]|uniref:Uncharacterized protein n=1 Tax=Enhygromyxa salina TaxID=215803 RepID=A0A0C2CUX4_9BACT|nr:hypothetical protein DB30_06228 [Enhygromyxa salina]